MILKFWEMPPSMRSVCICKATLRKARTSSIHERIWSSLEAMVRLTMRSFFQPADGVTKRVKSWRQLTARHCCPSCVHRWIVRSERLRRTPPPCPWNNRELLRRVERTRPVSSSVDGPDPEEIAISSVAAEMLAVRKEVTRGVPGELTSMPRNHKVLRESIAARPCARHC